MESQPQNPEFRNNPENFHPWVIKLFSYSTQLSIKFQWLKKTMLKYKDFSCFKTPKCINTANKC